MVDKAPLVYSDIPSPHEDLKSMLATLMACVQNLQVLTGERGETGKASSIRVFKKNLPSDPDPVGYKDGDLWVQQPLLPTDGWVLRVWINDAWQHISALT